MRDNFSYLLFIATLLSSIALFFTSSLLQFARKHRRLFFEQILQPIEVWGWYKRLHKLIFQDESVESFFFSLTSTQQALRVLVVVLFTTVYAGPLSLSFYLSSYAWSNLFEFVTSLFFLVGLILLFTLISDLLPRIWAQYTSLSLVRCTKWPVMCALILLSPLTYLLYKLIRLAVPQATLHSLNDPKKQLTELVEGLEEETTMNPHDKRLISSVFNFRDRIAREIMKPRVDLFCIPETMTIGQAADKMLEEGYSRVPIYHGNIDTITGILFYKDLLAAYVQQGGAKQPLLSASVKTIAKKVFYCPETKKISSLLQEFRKRQVHIAVVVDEYGGTSGVVTIEDILEELVGEIADEYDDLDTSYRKGPKGSWIVDAQMNLHDVSEDLGIDIPQGDDYDTIAGYVFYRLGSIPKSGIILHHDQFELKILKSNDRMVEEVLVTPIVSHHPSRSELPDERAEEASEPSTKE